MLDIEFIKNNPSQVKKALVNRGQDEEVVDRVLKLDDGYRQTLKKVESLRSERNTAAKERDIARGKKLKEELTRIEISLKSTETKLQETLSELPNLPLADVPVGDANKNKVLEIFGKPTEFPFKPKDHLELGERLGIIDTQAAAKVSGSRFGYLKGEAALLEFALVNFALEKLTAAGFVPIIPPALIRQEITNKLGYWQAGGNENYYLVSDFQGEIENPLYLIGTAEHAVVPMHEGDIIPAEDLPKRYAAFAPAFRREAGTYGKDTRGIFRVHQFEKLEMISFSRPEEGEAELKQMVNLAWELMKDLGLPIRKVVLATRDTSFPAAKTVDIETWFPSQKDYRETHSISTTTDFQARRLNTRFIKEGKTGFVHILNGTAFAIQRTLAAILENNQQADGSVLVPEALKEFVGFDIIRPEE